MSTWKGQKLFAETSLSNGQRATTPTIKNLSKSGTENISDKVLSTLFYNVIVDSSTYTYSINPSFPISTVVSVNLKGSFF